MILDKSNIIFQLVKLNLKKKRFQPKNHSPFNWFSNQIKVADWSRVQKFKFFGGLLILRLLFLYTVTFRAQIQFSPNISATVPVVSKCKVSQSQEFHSNYE